MAAVPGVLAAMGIVGFKGRKRNRSSPLIDVTYNTHFVAAEYATPTSTAHMHASCRNSILNSRTCTRHAHYRPAGVRTVPSLDMYTHLPPRDFADGERLLDLLGSLDASCSIATALLATSAVSV